jgi:hypothetical protein
MPKFLIRDYDDPRGFRTVHREVTASKMGWSRSGSFVPYALVDDGGTCVYARVGEHRGWTERTGWERYDAESSQKRRALCQSELGYFALGMPELTRPALSLVSRKIRNFLQAEHAKDAGGVEAFVNTDEFGKYFYSTTGFGRLGTTKPTDNAAGYRALVRALDGGTVAQQLNVHDQIGRVFLMRKVRGPMADAYTLAHRGPVLRPAVMEGRTVVTPAVYDPAKDLRPDWYEEGSLRGRTAKKFEKGTSAPTTDAVGIAPMLYAARIGSAGQARGRTVDNTIRDASRGTLRKPEPTGDTEKDAKAEEAYQRSLRTYVEGLPLSDQYYRDLDTRNLLFVGGPSGTTGTLLASALSIGGLPQTEVELMKQYALAIVGYLVGGGMHAYDEEMTVAAKRGVPYEPGAYIDSMPQTFLETMEFLDWNAEYYDIVTLGATHWMVSTQR